MISSDCPHPDAGSLKAKADRLVDVAYLFAIGASHPLLDRLGSLPLGLAVKKRGLERWNFVVVVACVYVALSVLDGEIASADFEFLAVIPFRVKSVKVSGPCAKLASTSAEDGNFKSLSVSDGERGIKECASFVQRALAGVPPSSGKQALATAIGSWVISSMYGKAPRPQVLARLAASQSGKWPRSDGELAAALGSLVASSFAPYWTERGHGA